MVRYDKLQKTVSVAQRDLGFLLRSNGGVAIFSILMTLLWTESCVEYNPCQLLINARLAVKPGKRALDAQGSGRTMGPKQ